MKLTGDRCQCTVCGVYFNSTKAFDKHRVGAFPHRVCRGAAEMVEAGMVLRDNGFWVASQMSEAKLKSIARLREQA